MSKTVSQPKAFTLIELLVVVAVIGILATVVVVNISSAQKKARDTKRRSDLQQIAKAAEMYFLKYDTYKIPNTGCANFGSGWFNYQDATIYPPGDGCSGSTLSYPNTIASGFENEGLFTKAPSDPKNPPNNGGYMYYPSNGKFAIYAKLELVNDKNSSGWDDGGLECGGPDNVYRMNLRVGNACE